MEKVQLPLNFFETIPESPTNIVQFENSSRPEDTSTLSCDAVLPSFQDSQTPSLSSSDELSFTVPPVTPHPRFSFSNAIDSLPPFPILDPLDLPYVREVGIKTSLDILGDYFLCPDYKLNPIQFWFLDVIVDCLWKLQDEFRFPERYQKIIIEWILHLFDLIRDPQRNLSRKEFFEIFNEALVIADERVQGGCEMLPKPEDLFSLVQGGEDEEISCFSGSGQDSSVSLVSGGESYVAVGIDEGVEIFEMPGRMQECYKRDKSIDQQSTEILTEESLCGCEDSIEFYQPDLNIPARFLSSSSASVETISEEEEPPEQKYLWKPSSLSADGPKRICSDDKLEPHPSLQTCETTDKSQSNIQEEWKEYLSERKEMVNDFEKNIMVNSCALYAIKEFVYDYFYESFQYTIVKLALMNRFTSITQHINVKWNIPKILKEELKKPKVKKEKKEKKKKGKKEKKPKKKTKKEKKKQKEKKKHSKKEKKPKKKKLTKEEKAELARQKREQERLEEEMRIAEENRRLIFPLKEATDDEFFKSIFDHWVKPKEKKQKGKGKRKK